MKRFLVFTLTLLFATTCLLLTDLHALDQDFQSATEFAGNVYGSTYVCTWFDKLTETAHSSHSVAVDNDGIGAVKLYGTFRVEVYWNGGSVTPPPETKEKKVPGNSFGSAYHDFSFLLRQDLRKMTKFHLFSQDSVRLETAPTGGVRKSYKK